VLATLAGLVGAGTAWAGAPLALWKSSGAIDFSFGSTARKSGLPTGEKPESKLFFTQDAGTGAVRWWGVFGRSSPSGVWLFELVNHVWQSRIQLPSADPWEKADTLFDPSTRRLYVAMRDKRSLEGNPRESHLYRLDHDGSGGWTLASGPTRITTANPETLTIALDGVGRLWTTYRSGTTIKIGYTAPGGTAFTLKRLPGSAAVTSDDISAITAFTDSDGRPKIGVMWSDQESDTHVFAWRYDTSDPASGWRFETAYGDGVGGCAAGDRCSDDHVNLKVHEGAVYAVIKTSLDAEDAPSSDPLIVMLRRAPSGAWTAFPVSPISQNASRPIVLLHPDADTIYVFAQKNFDGTYFWTSSLSSPSFDSGSFTAWTIRGTDNVGDPTSTRQNVSGGTGVVVETSFGSSKNEYWHNELLPAP
jgi:hypothetical protein